MTKYTNKFWTKQCENIAAGAFCVALALAVVTMRYMNYFL